MSDVELPYVSKPHDFLDLGPVEVEPLAKMVSGLPAELWSVADTLKENKFNVFDHTQHIIFRFTTGNIDPRKHYDTPFWKTWERHLTPVMDTVVSQYEHKQPAYSKVMLALLKSGQRIAPHVDGGGSNLTSHKIHIPLQSNPKATLSVRGKERHLEVGRAYEINNIAKHGAENLGSQDRIHLIFEHYNEVYG